MPYKSLYKGRVSIPGQTYLITTVTAHRCPVFADIGNGRFAVNAMREIDTQGVSRTLAFVVMPDHVHWLFELQSSCPLGAMMNLFKGRTARRINQRTQSTTRLWQPAYHDHAIRDEESLVDTARYIIMNPVRANLVTRIGDYPLWDSIWISRAADAFRL